MVRPVASQRKPSGSNPTRNLSADNDDQVAEDQVGPDKAQRRDAQRRLGLDVHVNGRFDDETRNVIKRWQATRHRLSHQGAAHQGGSREPPFRSIV